MIFSLRHPNNNQNKKLFSIILVTFHKLFNFYGNKYLSIKYACVYVAMMIFYSSRAMKLLEQPIEESDSDA